jgi:peptidyl-prolyl cis-trans isomerase B (cyclophilin B)
MQETTTSLDGQYAAFGKVTSGMYVVDKIANNVQVTDSNGTVATKNQPVITSIRMK